MLCDFSTIKSLCMGVKRGVNQLTWDDFPVRQEADGWHCRKCGILLTGRKRAWCSQECLKSVLLTVEWRYIRRCILRRDKYRCQLCPNRATQVDHIIELADGGSFHEWSNLRALCVVCHKAKTQIMRKARAEKKKQAVLHTEDNSMSNFSSIKMGSTFTDKEGSTYKKTSELTFDDTAGIEHYIDPFFDKTIVVTGAPDASVPAIKPKPAAKKAAAKKTTKAQRKK